MSINWNEVEESASGAYKPYATPGKYKVKCEGCTFEEVGTNGSVVQKFHFAEDDKFAYPTADHWLSFKNDNWRIWHNKCLMELLGASEDKAKKALETIEAKSDKEAKIKLYAATYDALLKRAPEVEIEVWQDGKYARAEFVDSSVAMPHDNDNSGDAVSEVLPDAEEVGDEVDLSDIPFN